MRVKIKRLNKEEFELYIDGERRGVYTYVEAMVAEVLRKKFKDISFYEGDSPALKMEYRGYEVTLMEEEEKVDEWSAEGIAEKIKWTILDVEEKIEKINQEIEQDQREFEV
jgi:hypothetical protein